MRIVCEKVTGCTLGYLPALQLVACCHATNVLTGLISPSMRSMQVKRAYSIAVETSVVFVYFLCFARKVCLD
jgi:hypothetical protein